MSSVDNMFGRFFGSNCLASADLIHPNVPLIIEAHTGEATCSVVSLFADNFLCPRNLCCLSEANFISSLSRCEIWESKGGKSGAVFEKTIDGRFIIKEIKRIEYDSFMKFGFQYISYMKNSLETGYPTCLVKIFGIYKVEQPNGMKKCLMVTENLMYGRSFSRTYDMKGALFKRKTSNAAGDVRLDQNFVEDLINSPLFVGLKANRLLQIAVWNDTLFLASINVMDYSLLVGVNPDGKEIVCGIIDYLREYSWDKLWETAFKLTVVVPKDVSPTVIPPQDYKKRFRTFMETYFPTVPEIWCSRRPSEDHSIHLV